MHICGATHARHLYLLDKGIQVYLLTHTDRRRFRVQTKPQPLSVHEGKKGSVTYRISNETLSVAPGFAYPKAGATNHPNFPVKLLFLY